MAEPIRCPHAEPGSAPAGPECEPLACQVGLLWRRSAHDGAGYVSGAAEPAALGSEAHTRASRDRPARWPAS